MRDRLAFICGPSVTTIEEVDAARLLPKQIFRPNILIFFEALAAGGGAFAMTQGFLSSRTLREKMERVAHTATTVAGMLLKGVKPGDMRREVAQLHVFNCLALITAYPVCILNRNRGNTHDPCVVKLCGQAAKRLQKLRPIEKDDTGTESETHASSVTIQEGTRNQMEHFFEILSLKLELEFRASFSRSKLPSMAPQRIMHHIRSHLDDLTDFCELDPVRSPIIRENADVLALAGRECGIYSYRDNVNPIAFLWTIDIAARVLCLSIPIQTCTTLAWSMMGRAVFDIMGVSLVTATALTILHEIWRLWDPYAKGVNMYSWTLGVAREIDAMLNDVYDSDRDMEGLPLRKHGYNDWKMPTDSPPTAEEELPLVVDELYRIRHQLEGLTCCHEGI